MFLPPYSKVVLAVGKGLTTITYIFIFTQVTYDLIEGHLPPPGLTVLGADPTYPVPYR